MNFFKKSQILIKLRISNIIGFIAASLLNVDDLCYLPHGMCDFLGSLYCGENVTAAHLCFPLQFGMGSFFKKKKYKKAL